MKRLLSILLAAALIISLVPAIFAADATDGTIVYNIKRTSVSNDLFNGEIIAPVETTEGSENFGYIKFTDNTYLQNTKYAILHNSEGLFSANDKTNIANSEISLVTYRTIDYHAFVKSADGSAIPVRKPATDYANYLGKDGATTGFKVVSEGSSEIKTYTISETVDLSKTAPFELFGKCINGAHGFLYDEGFRGTLTVGKNGANLNNPDSLGFAVRIKIPEDAATGKYKVKLGSDHINPKTVGIYNDPYSSETNVYITKIDPNTGLEAKWAYNSGCYSSFTDASGNAVSEEAYASENNKLTGTYCSTNGNKTEFPDVRNFEAGAEYLVYFRINPETTLKTLEDGGYNIKDNRQNFHLSTIELLPLKEEVPPTLKSATISYDNATNTVSVSSAKMNDGTDATGYTVTYGMTGATNAKINSATGVVTPGTEDETVSFYADVTLDGTTVRATLENVLIKGYVEGRLNYVLSSDSLNASAKEEIAALDGTKDSILNSELNLVSWKTVYYTNSNNTPVKVAPGTEGATTLSNILNTALTDKFELPGRGPEDNVPRFIPNGFISQFVCRRWTNETEIKSESYRDSKLANRPKYIIKLYVPEKGAYKLSLSNNFSLSAAQKIYGKDFFTTTDNNIESLGREAYTEVYFSKADFDLPYGSTAPKPSEENLQKLLSAENRIGWYDSGRYGETTTYNDKVLIAREPGEYYLTLTTCPESYDKSSEVWHREFTNGTFADYQIFALSEITLTPVAEDEEYTKDFDAKEETYVTGGTGTVNAYTFTDKEESISLDKNTVELGKTITLSAPGKSGYDFLYWAKGASDSKQIVSYDKRFTYKPSEGANYLIAVYKPKGAEINRAEFYNANGSLVKALDADGAAPELPSMAGFGNASGWQLYGTDEVIEAGVAVTVSGTKIYVAKYPEAPGKVEVNGVEYTYGETVTMPTLDTTKIFKGWKRNGEIVSVDPSYTFKAWEDATVEAVYAENEPAFSGRFMKIVIDAFEAGNETAVMAEFIGFGDNVVEKGIKIGNKKVAMKSGDSQFSILADVKGEYIGYAILRDGDGFIEVTDGSENIE